jgi:CBS domain-containing protein
VDDSDRELTAFLGATAPFDCLTPDELARVAGSFSLRMYPAGTEIFAAGEPLPGLYLIRSGTVEVGGPGGAPAELRGAGETAGERGLMRDGRAVGHARAAGEAVLLLLPASEFRRLADARPEFAAHFGRSRTAEPRGADLATRRVAELMTRAPLTCRPDESVRAVAERMREAHVSSLGVVDGGRFTGIITTRDLAGRVLAAGRDPATPVHAVMTPDPVTLTPDALVSDVLHLMLERRIGHLPVVEGDRLVGIVTQTDLTRFQAVSSALLVRDAAAAATVAEMAAVTARIPQLLRQLVEGNNPHQVVTRLVTDIADTVTRRLLALAEAELGPPPVPYLWLACGSQGRQEQTGVSDQDNCLMIDDAATPDDMAWFARLARLVSDGLNTCGYVYCPGDMMATNPRWCQPVRVWRDYFAGWVSRPDPMAQMLASVMFDLRPIGGQAGLFRDLQAETLELAAQNSIFVAHMIANSLKHAPPLGLLRGFATIRSGEYRNHIDMKHGGVVPVVDLGRIYALRGRLTPVNTRARLTAAEDAGIISRSGARDLIEAYDLIAEMRLTNQATLVRMGRRPDNYLAPGDLGDFERSHLRDAFVVVRTMQSALGHGRSAPV